MKQNKHSSFFDKKVVSALRSESPFFLKGFDFRLLPLILPSLKKRGLIFYKGPSGPVYGGLLLFIEKFCAFYDRDFLSREVSLSGFKGYLDEGRNLFHASLKDSFKNHSFVLFPEDLFNKKVFNSYVNRAGFVVNKKTSYSSLLSRLKSLGYRESDFVGERGEFALRGMVVDFFPFSYSSGIRVVFEGGSSKLFRFNVESQLASESISVFHLESAQVIQKRVSFSSLVSKEDFSFIYLLPGGVSFFNKSPDISFFSSFKPLSLSESFSGGGVSFFNSPCMVSFSLEGEKFVPSWTKRESISKSLSEDVYVDFSQLEVGDFLVHADFGIGKYLGVSFLDNRESLILGFKNTRINVFPSYFKKISFYKRAGSAVEEDFVGVGSRWRGRVSLAKKAASLVAKDLIKSFAIRKTSFSDVYYLDQEIESSFLKGFPFQDTVDQGVVWGEIKKDLLSKTPMERLLCGDVGFGKTELAIRSCFLSSINGFSSIVLAPTTILTKQLVSSFRSRLNPFGVRVGEVSRLVSSRDQRVVFESFLSGKIDVLVGTHKISFEKELLQKASLVVVDDEHRFGVKQKEEVKSCRPGVNMLYMSATPIPRSLKMALSNITSISTLSSPPPFKLPTSTYVDYFSEKIIKKAVFEEVSRGGQVFFIHNKVKKIPSVVSFLKNLLPGVQIDFLHGQEPPSDVLKKIEGFVSKKIDLLVASSIVESGVDISSVNTIIINDAHLFGVSQLYQMRGRVGRGEIPSFAYLLVPQKHSLSSVSKNRLKIIEKNSSLGSCYAVAMEDLGLRGGGAVFGYRQSGSVGRVGFDLYNRFLNEAVASFSSPSKEPRTECSLSSPLPSYVPKEYIPSSKMRVWVYKEISSISSLGGLELFSQKLVDLFGPIPLFLNNLLLLRRLEVLGGLCFFSKFSFEGDFFKGSFCSFFWKNKIESLFNALIGYKFVLAEGGKVLRVCGGLPELERFLILIYKEVINSDD